MNKVMNRTAKQIRMIRNKRLEFGVGVFVLLGLAAVAYLTVRLGAGDLVGSQTYPLEARFANTGGLNEGSMVMLGGVTALLPIYAKDVLAVDSWGLGLMRGAPAIGALIVSVVLARWSIQRKAGRYMFGSVVVYAGALLVFGVSHSLALSVVALAISGAADMVSVVIRQSLVQIDTPDEMRGKVSAINSVCIVASNHLGDFRAGMTAHGLGAAGAVTLGAVGSLLVGALWIRWFPQLWRRETLSGDN